MTCDRAMVTHGNQRIAMLHAIKDQQNMARVQATKDQRQKGAHCPGASHPGTQSPVLTVLVLHTQELTVLVPRTHELTALEILEYIDIET